MQSAEEFADIIESEGVSFDLGGGYHWDSAKVAARIAARDAEWQARVDKLEAERKRDDAMFEEILALVQDDSSTIEGAKLRHSIRMVFAKAANAERKARAALGREA